MSPMNPKNLLKALKFNPFISNSNKSELTIKRSYNSKDTSKEYWNNIRQMIEKKIQNRSDSYPKSMISVANQVLHSRLQLISGVSSLLQAFPVLTCKFCSEVYVGETGHLIRSCWGYHRLNKNQIHQWMSASVHDILVPIETFHLDNRVKDAITHHQRVDFECVPAVVELCLQAGAHPVDLNHHSNLTLMKADSLSTDELQMIGTRTLEAWELYREGVKKLLLVYPVKVCKHCSEVHVGHLSHKARLCGIFKDHCWEKAGVDDLVPPKIVWYHRPQDPPALLNEGRTHYGHAPAVVNLCCKAGARPHAKYSCMMKVQGLTKPPQD